MSATNNRSYPDLPPRWRIARRIRAIGLISIISLPSAACAIHPQATPRAADIVQVMLTTNVTTAHIFTLNGAPQPGRVQFIFTPRAGNNTLTLTAPPFAPLSCHFTWNNLQLQGTAGDCATDGESRSAAPHQPIIVTYMVTMGFTLADLPTSIQSSALSAMRAISLPGQPLTAKVPAGDYYATGNGPHHTILSQRAASPLSATMGVAPDVDSVRPFSEYIYNAQQLSAIPDHLWLMDAGSLEAWRFTDAHGAVVGTVGVPHIYGDLPLALDYSRTTLVSVEFPVPVSYNRPIGAPCETGDYVFTLIAPQWDGKLYPTLENGSDLLGCAFSLRPQQGTSTPEPPLATMPRFIFRFGVLLAENDLARQLAPDLPLAPPAEIVAVDHG